MKKLMLVIIILGTALVLGVAGCSDSKDTSTGGGGQDLLLPNPDPAAPIDLPSGDIVDNVEQGGATDVDGVAVPLDEDIIDDEELAEEVDGVATDDNSDAIDNEIADAGSQNKDSLDIFKSDDLTPSCIDFTGVSPKLTPIFLEPQAISCDEAKTALPEDAGCYSANFAPADQWRLPPETKCYEFNGSIIISKVEIRDMSAVKIEVGNIKDICEEIVDTDCMVLKGKPKIFVPIEFQLPSRGNLLPVQEIDPVLELPVLPRPAL